MKNKKLYILTFIIVVAIASVCIPVLAKNNNSYYANRVTGDSLYVAAGNIGNVEADTDINIPINIGGSDYVAHGIRLTIEYEPEYFEFVSISLNDNVKCGTNNPFRMFNDETNGWISGAILCNNSDGIGTSFHGELLNLELHTTSNFTGDHPVRITVNELYYLPLGSQYATKIPYLKFDGVVSSSNVYNSVVFVDWNGTILDQKKILGNANPTDIITPHRLGYDFTGWSEELDELNSSALVFPLYQIKNYTVTFVDGTDNSVISTQIVNYSDSVNAPTIPEHEGYTFTSWDKDFTFIDSNLTITAQYQSNS